MNKVKLTDMSKTGLRDLLRGYMSEGDLVMCGTHDTAPWVTESVLDQVIHEYTREDIQTEEYEPPLWVVGNVDANRKGEIFAAWQEWYISGLGNDQVVLDGSFIDYYDTYQVSTYHDEDTEVFFVTIFGDTPMDDDEEVDEDVTNAKIAGDWYYGG